jgi:ribosomal protein S18 acetylase RimI-like enzyme
MRGGGVRVRRMRADDVTALDAIMRAAYGLERPFGERMAAALHQRGALPLVAEHGGRVAGAVFGNDYATSAYVSLMGVDPAFQGRGIGYALMTALVAWCDERGFRDVRLDATPAGAPLYERFGFADFDVTVVFVRERVVERAPAAHVAAAHVAAAHVAAAQADDAETIARIDAAAFGADRTPVLEPMLAAHRAFIAGDADGYVVVQRTASAVIVGPWIARDAGVARDLLDTALANAGEREPTLFVPRSNGAACELVAAAGFVPQRALRHMIRGAGRKPSPAVFGRASLGQG